MTLNILFFRNISLARDLLAIVSTAGRQEGALEHAVYKEEPRWNYSIKQVIFTFQKLSISQKRKFNISFFFFQDPKSEILTP